MKGIDVAKWNGTIKWDKVKTAGISFAILKVINKQCREEDAFQKNYVGATTQGITVGCYNYSYATTVEKARQDAGKVLQVLNGRKMPCGVWLDVEDKCQQGIGHLLIDIINAYRQVIEYAGYEFGVYTGLYFYNTYLKPYASELKCQFWIARYPSGAKVMVSYNPPEGKKPGIRHALWGWQYSSKGSVAGITGDVDLDLYYGEVAPVQHPTLKKGSAGECVKELQELLIKAGYSCGKYGSDGKFGDGTLEAVNAFQADRGLVVDGVVGAKTWAELYKS